MVMYLLCILTIVNVLLTKWSITTFLQFNCEGHRHHSPNDVYTNWHSLYHNLVNDLFISSDAIVFKLHAQRVGLHFKKKCVLTDLYYCIRYKVWIRAMVTW